MPIHQVLTYCATLLCLAASLPAARAGNPIAPGWYADPEVAVVDGAYWVFPTTSAAYDQQLHFDAFSSPDLVHWTKHERVLTADDIAWARRAMWAPCCVEKDGRFYLFFGANDLQRPGGPMWDPNDKKSHTGGIGVAVADNPAGPYEDLLGELLIGGFHHGAQPIDQCVFRDDDGTHYFFYGGWGHCNVGVLNDDFTGFVPFEDGQEFHEVTPAGYVEGPLMLKRDLAPQSEVAASSKPSPEKPKRSEVLAAAQPSPQKTKPNPQKYYFMWSEGGWGDDSYRVAYAIADSPLGPFERLGTVLSSDPEVATGAGHHSVVQSPTSGQWYIVYHRRPIPNEGRDHRVTCVDRLDFNDDGTIRPVRMTFEGVAPDPITTGETE